MSNIERKPILFICSPTHDMKPIEHFLKKRNFNIYLEVDVKSASIKVSELQPIIVFLAWDHPNTKIIDLAKVLVQSSNITIVPFVMSSAKEDIRKLDICNLKPKLYPPVSGPAFERLITKFSNEAMQKNLDSQETVNRNKMGKDVSNLPESHPDYSPQITSVKNIESETPSPSRIQTPNFILFRSQSIKKRTEILIQYKRKQLPEMIATQLKATFHVKIKIPIENLLKNISVSRNLTETEFQKVYCVSVYSDDWCGYLTVVSTLSLEYSTIGPLLSDWLSSQFGELLEIDENDFVELDKVEPNMVEKLSVNADYFENMQIGNYQIHVGFFSIDPAKMNIEMNEENTLIKISTPDVPTDEALKFSLHLHLPENKKYIVYTQMGKKLSLEQKNRLIVNKIMMLYTPLDFETEYKKFIVEKNVKDFCQSPVKKKSAV